MASPRCCRFLLQPSPEDYARFLQSCSCFQACHNLSQEYVSVCCIRKPHMSELARTYLESIFPAEPFLAVFTRKWFDRHVDPLMSLQVVVAVEASRALVALARLVVWMSRSCPWVHAVHLMGLHARVWITLHRHLSKHHWPIRTVEAILHELPGKAWKVVVVIGAIPVRRSRWGLHRV